MVGWTRDGSNAIEIYDDIGADYVASLERDHAVVMAEKKKCYEKLIKRMIGAGEFP